MSKEAQGLGLPAHLSGAGTSPEGPVATHWVENRPSTRWLPRVDLTELWDYRELLFFLALRDLKLRYKQTAFGVTWAVLQPLAAAAVFTLVFGRLVHVPSEGIPYPVFAFTGLTVWLFVSNGVSAAAESLAEHRDLVTKAYFPRVLAPVAAILPGLVDLAFSLVIVGVAMALYGVTTSAALALLPAWVLAALLVAIAAGLWLAALNALYRDFRYALGFILQLWLYISPVIFPASLVKGDWLYVYAINPMVGVIEGFRWSVLAAPAPGAESLVSLASGLLLLIGGLLYFHSVERRLADRI